jgi:hypothetical protein
MNGVLNKKDIVQHRILPNTKSATNRENKKATKHLKEKIVCGGKNSKLSEKYKKPQNPQKETTTKKWPKRNRP